MNKSIYMPAISLGPLFDAFIKNKKHKNGKSYRFYKPDGIFTHDCMLVSAGHTYLKKPDLKSDMEYDYNDIMIFGDSGGFQIAVGKLENTESIRSGIFKWLEKNSNYASNIDVPPYVSTNNKKGGSFTECLNKSIANFQYFSDNRSGSTRYLNVLHGRGIRDITEWYDGVKHFDFKGGWAIGSASVNLYYTLLSFFLLYENGEFDKYNGKNAIIHIFGCSKSYIMMFLIYLQQVLNRKNIDLRISYDSSYPMRTAAFGNYFLFSKKDGVTAFKMTNRADYSHSNLDVELPCDCPVCNDLTFGDLFRKEFNSDFYNLVSLHNIWKILEYKRMIESFTQLDNNTIYENLFNKKEINIFQIINAAFDCDSPTKYIDKFRDELSAISFEETESDSGFLDLVN